MPVLLVTQSLFSLCMVIPCRPSLPSLLFTSLLLSLFSFVHSDSLYDSNDPILQLDIDNFNSSVYGQNRAFFVEFYSSWCGACIGYAPTYKKFAKQLESWSPIVQVSAVNCAEDKNMPLCREHQIAAFPTIKYFKYKSVSASDVTVFKGDKYDLQALALTVAEDVHWTWEAERPPEWPSFEAIAHSTTLNDIWSTANEAKLVLLYSQDEPAHSAWAATIAYARDKRVRTAIARPNHAEVLKHVGSVIDNKALIFERNSNKPVFISAEKITYAELLEKVAEFEAQAIGGDLDKVEAPKEVIPIAGEKKYDSSVWSDLSQYQLQSVDLESAIAYMLTREVERKETIDGENLDALKRWTQTIAKYSPVRIPLRRFLLRLSSWLSSQPSISSSDWSLQLSSLQSQLGNPIPYEIQWLACKGSRPNLRGYTCGLWTLAHAITVEAYKAEANNPSFDAVRDVLAPFRDFITHFLSCGECAENFGKETLKHNMLAASRREDMVMWLWNTHNSVNTRLAGAPAEDPQHPKRIFPPKELCSACYKQDGSFDQEAALQFVLNYYGNVKNDAAKPDPEFTVKTFVDGKVVEAEKRHFNPRPKVVGAQKVDKLEDAEERARLARAQVDASPHRTGRQLDDFRQELVGEGRPSRGGSPFVVISLSITAFLVILIYCKYRRNRSKFWKTFYYSNDFKLPWHAESTKQYTA